MDKETKRVCVFMQVYRNEPSMHQAIQSVLEQTYQEFVFCVLVRPETKDVVQKYAEKDARVWMYDGQVNQSTWEYFRAQQDMVRKSSCAYFTRIDADDWYDPHYLEKLIAFAKQHHTDITACGNDYRDAANQSIGVRQQNELVWETKNTAQLLPYVYGFFRTIWGKLIAAELILNQDIENLPEYSRQYGSYGMDTMFTFNLLPRAKRIGICGKVLYHYRMTTGTNSSSMLKEGRLDSDRILFRFVENILHKCGKCTEEQKRFLYVIYGNALVDTVTLLEKHRLTEKAKAEKLRYLLNNDLTDTLFEKERAGELEHLNGRELFARKLYGMVLQHRKKGTIPSEAAEPYRELFTCLFPKWKDKLSTEEFLVLANNKPLLDTFVHEEFETLFALLLKLLKRGVSGDPTPCLLLLRRVVQSVVLPPVLQEEKFVVKYADLLQKINEGESKEIFPRFQELFTKKKALYQPQVLATLWANTAALFGEAEEYIAAKTYQMESLIQANDFQAAAQEYEVLEQLGVYGERMDALRDLLKGAC